MAVVALEVVNQLTRAGPKRSPASHKARARPMPATPAFNNPSFSPPQGAGPVQTAIEGRSLSPGAAKVASG